MGGTLDRLAKARVSKGAPLVDVTLTTSHVGRLYLSDGLFQKLDLAKIPSSGDLAREAMRSDAHLGAWSYVYTIAYRPDLVGGMEIAKWADLWDPRLKGKIGMPDFDPSHIIVISALLEGGNEVNWQKGQERLKRLKPNIAAFFSTDARSQDLMKTGEAPVQVMLSINGYHLIDQGLNLKVDRAHRQARDRGHRLPGHHGRHQEGRRRVPIHQSRALQGRPGAARGDLQGGAHQPQGRGPRQAPGATRVSSPRRRSGRSAATSWTMTRAPRRSLPGKSGSTPPSWPSKRLISDLASDPGVRAGIDVGGTFTDVVAWTPAGHLHAARCRPRRAVRRMAWSTVSPFSRPGWDG